MRGRPVCRLHGGNGCGPRGERNGAYRTGRYTAELGNFPEGPSLPFHSFVECPYLDVFSELGSNSCGLW